jgi:dihydroorotate dehydrogenase
MFSFVKPTYPLLLAAAKNNPEAAHKQMLDSLAKVDRSRHTAWGKAIIQQCRQSFCYSSPRLAQHLWGLDFVNPVGLAAGCDKDGVAAGMWANFGFGFAELGGVTLHAQTGNPLPRLFRLPLDKAALNRMGANNLGASVMGDTLRQAWARQARTIPVGINLIKSKIAPLEEAAEDYLGSFLLLRDRADYFVINVSSPNTPGLRLLQEGEQLNRILSNLQRENTTNIPLFVKISPDLAWEDIRNIVNIAQNNRIAGIVATNTTLDRDNLQTQVVEATGKLLKDEAGGISGAPLKKRSTDIIRFVYLETNGKLPIIGIGGIFSAEDAWEKIAAGASLLQIYTGWIYQGPWVVSNILEGLMQKLKQNGFEHISEAVGSGLTENRSWKID